MPVSNRANGQQPQRDSKGRFLRGCKPGPGNPNVRRLSRYQTAIKAAVKPTDLKAVMRKLVQLARGGNLQATKELLDRAVGRAPAAAQVAEEGGLAGVGLKLPALTSASDLPAAMSSILQALSSGHLDADAAMKAASVIELARRAIETAEIEERLRKLEEERDID